MKLIELMCFLIYDSLLRFKCHTVRPKKQNAAKKGRGFSVPLMYFLYHYTHNNNNIYE